MQWVSSEGIAFDSSIMDRLPIDWSRVSEEQVDAFCQALEGTEDQQVQELEKSVAEMKMSNGQALAADAFTGPTSPEGDLPDK